MHEGKARTYRVTLSTSWQQILDYSELRVALILSVLGAGTVYIVLGHPSDGPLAPGQGHPISASNSPFQLTSFLQLRAAHGPVWASASADGTQLIVSEILVGPACRDRLNPFAS